MLSVRITNIDISTNKSYIDLSLDKPCLYNLGSFRSRAYEFLYTGNNPLRLSQVGFEITGNVGKDTEE